MPRPEHYEVVCWGGPLDGLETWRRSMPPRFGWMAHDGRMYRAPRKDTHPYRFASVYGQGPIEHSIVVRLAYAGADRVCSSCGAEHRGIAGPATCALCGGELRAIRELVRRTTI